MVLESYRLLFVHIPKNAGTSIEAIFDRKWTPRQERPNPSWPEPFSHHTALKKYLRDQRLTGFHSFAIVRNPWDRLVSCYAFDVKMAGLEKGMDRHNRQLAAQGVSFKDYVMKADYEGILLRPQLDWLTTTKPARTVDTILRFETLAEDYRNFAHSHGLPEKELPHKNKSSHKHYSEYYDQETIDHVAKIYASDIREFGYSFNRS